MRREPSLEEILNIKEFTKSANADLKNAIEKFKQLEEMYSLQFLEFGSSEKEHMLFEEASNRIDKIKEAYTFFCDVERYFDYVVNLKIELDDAKYEMDQLAKAFD